MTWPHSRDQSVPDVVASRALASTAIIKLNGGLGTSMGLDRAKSLLRARDELTFLDLIARQVLALRRRHGTQLPITFLNSFRTSRDTLEALTRYPGLGVERMPLEILQNRVPKLRADDLTPVQWPRDRSLEWCPPGHGDLYTVLYATGLLGTLLDLGFTQAFVSNSDNLGARADPRRGGLVRPERRTVRRRGGATNRQRSQGWTLRPTTQRRSHRAARDSPDRTRGPCSARPTWTGTGSPRPTTSGSSWRRCRRCFARTVASCDFR